MYLGGGAFVIVYEATYDFRHERDASCDCSRDRSLSASTDNEKGRIISAVNYQEMTSREVRRWVWGGCVCVCVSRCRRLPKLREKRASFDWSSKGPRWFGGYRG
jgi:hypothetical protein